MRVKINEIDFDKGQYPRDGVDDEIVAQYRVSLDNLPPILLNKNKKLVEILSVSHQNISKWLTDTIREKRGRDKEKALELYLDYLNYPTQDDVAEALDGEQSTIGRWLSNMQNANNSKMHNPPEELQITTAWEFKLCDPDMGIKNYPGQLAGQLIENLLWYYTEPFDLVFSINQEPLERDRKAWNGNLVHIFNWKEGLPFGKK
jgi:hypothetical protein